MISDEYLLALGRFVHSYSLVERVLHLTFHKFAGVSLEKANILKKESSAANLIYWIRGLLPMSDITQAEQETVLSCLRQFEHISTFRHSVIHRGADGNSDGTFAANNIPTMRSLESYEVATFSIDDITHAHTDLSRINILLACSAGMGHPLVQTPEAKSLLQGPWRYKPVQLMKPHSAPPTKKPKQPPRQ